MGFAAQAYIRLASKVECPALEIFECFKEQSDECLNIFGRSIPMLSVSGVLLSMVGHTSLSC